MNRVITEYLLELEHDLPLNNVSKRHPDALIDRWCNGRVDYVEVSCKTEEECRRVSQDIRTAMSTRRPDLLLVTTRGRRLSSTVRCTCNPMMSSFVLAETHNCLWKAPIKYRNGKESLSLIAFSESDFRDLFDEYKRLGEARILRKAFLSSESLGDTATLSLETLVSGLTSRQLEAIITAINMGYYDIPRSTSITRIAFRLGLSASTVEEHLSKAEMKIARALAPYLKMYGGVRRSYRADAFREN